jgi:hypothetical protein
LYDNKGKKDARDFKYAISYKVTGIIDLRKEVKIVSERTDPRNGAIVLIKKKPWFLLKKRFKFTDERILNGQGIDFK